MTGIPSSTSAVVNGAGLVRRTIVDRLKHVPRSVTLGLSTFLLICLAIALAPVLIPQDPNSQDLSASIERFYCGV